MKKLMLLLFGHKPITHTLRPTTKFKTTSLSNRPSFEQWVKEFNVSMLWDRRIVKMD